MNKSIKKEVYSFIMKEIKNPFWRTAAEYGTITISIWIMVIGIYFFKFPNHFAFGRPLSVLTNGFLSHHT